MLRMTFWRTGCAPRSFLPPIWRTLSNENKSHGINANALAFERFAEVDAQAGVPNCLGSFTPLGIRPRVPALAPSEAVSAAIFLVSVQARHVGGQVLIVA